MTTEQQFRTRVGNLLLYTTLSLVALVALLTISGGFVREQSMQLLIMLAAIKTTYILALIKYNAAHKYADTAPVSANTLLRPQYVRMVYGIVWLEFSALVVVLLATWASADWITFEGLTGRWLPGIETLFGAYLGFLLPDLFRAPSPTPGNG